MSERDAESRHQGHDNSQCLFGAFFLLFFSNRWFEKENHKEEQEGKEASALKLVKNNNTWRNASGSVWLAPCVSPIKLGEVQNNLTG